MKADVRRSHRRKPRGRRRAAAHRGAGGWGNRAGRCSGDGQAGGGHFLLGRTRGVGVPARGGRARRRWPALRRAGVRCRWQAGTAVRSGPAGRELNLRAFAECP
jgi:hypothetical protein